jgi:thiopurine S-methyltransferase
LQPEFWHERWRTGHTAFHQSAVDRHLAKHWPNLGVAPGSRVFVPLCGKSLDLLWLRDRGHSVVGVELSALALESFCMEHGIPARRRGLGKFDVYEAPGLELYCGDFFALTPKLLGAVSALYDRAALVSWTPELRAAYVAHISALTAPGTRTLLITLEYPQAQMSGPPFSVTADDVGRLYGRQHAIEQLSRDDILASEPRLRSRGLEELHEISFHLSRQP